MAGKMFPAFPGHAQPAILHIWQETHSRKPRFAFGKCATKFRTHTCAIFLVRVARWDNVTYIMSSFLVNPYTNWIWPHRLTVRRDIEGIMDRLNKTAIAYTWKNDAFVPKWQRKCVYCCVFVHFIPSNNQYTFSQRRDCRPRLGVINKHHVNKSR